MTQQHLSPCPGCDRHVRAGEAECPFCGAEIPLPPAPFQLPRKRLSRAAYVAFRAAVAGGVLTVGAAGLTACGTSRDGTLGDAGSMTSDSDGGGDTDGGGSGDSGSGGDDAGSGGDDAGSGGDDAGAVDAGFDAGNAVPPYGAPAYGAPAPPDGGAD